MWKMIIMDDEAIIRRGLRKALDWESLNIEIVAEAEDGEIGIEKCKEHLPNIILVDICMPFINGLEMIEAISDIVPDSIVFIISGFGEFEYAKQAIKLDVFDYILKPVDEDYLKNRIIKAISLLEEKHLGNDKPIDITKQREYNSERKKIFIKLLRNEQIDNQDETLAYYNLVMSERFGLMVILNKKTDEYYNIQSHNEFVSHTQNIIIDDILKTIIEDNKRNFIGEIDGGIVVKINFTDNDDWNAIKESIKQVLNEKMKNCQTVIKTEIISDGAVGISKAYNDMLQQAQKERKCTPLVLSAKKYIDENYMNRDLSLSDVAEVVQCNPSYLSKLLKKELGNSFIDYLTSVRIRKSIELISSTTLRINEIAEMVGYNTQHYFSASFKKVVGMSPNSYKSHEANSDG